ncbi:MAG: pre-peptidase C-terminal domain-containing protein, partial [Deltaproteobacteria bacterium]|nr:pre-peptidase C-terminal domain-containing protein [Deltaproteobacteria bacterium]
MRPTHRLILLALIILIFGTIPAVFGVTPAAADFTGTIIDTVICADSPQSYGGNISERGQVDYWAIDLVAGQKLIINVDAENIGMLDALLMVLDSDGTLVGWNNDQEGDGPADISLDPYLEVTVPSYGGDVTYYIGIGSATTDPLDDRNTGPYTFFVQ